jgi:chorismate mutase
MYTLFDSFFSPTRVVVVSEERLQQAEKELKENQLRVIDNRIEELTAYRANLAKQIAPAKSGADLDALDGGTHDG